jgi:predicted ferric reductase
MSSQLLWYTARAAGIVAWALAAASVIWGLVVSTRAVAPRPKPAWWFDLHRFLGGAAVAFTGIHVLSILLDTYVHFGLVNVLVPLTGSWRPVAVAWGIVGMYLLAAIEVTSLLRARIPKKVWRAVHFTTFALYLVATVHAFSAGTDTWSIAFVAAAMASLVAVGSLTLLRVWQSSQSRPTSVQSFRSGANESMRRFSPTSSNMTVAVVSPPRPATASTTPSPHRSWTTVSPGTTSTGGRPPRTAGT